VERWLWREIAGILALKPAPPLFRAPEFICGMPLDANWHVRCGIPEIINESGTSLCLCVLFLCQLVTCEYMCHKPSAVVLNGLALQNVTSNVSVRLYCSCRNKPTSGPISYEQQRTHLANACFPLLFVPRIRQNAIRLIFTKNTAASLVRSTPRDVVTSAWRLGELAVRRTDTFH